MIFQEPLAELVAIHRHLEGANLQPSTRPEPRFDIWSKAQAALRPSNKGTPPGHQISVLET